jgi:hypothetical protein
MGFEQFLRISRDPEPRSGMEFDEFIADFSQFLANLRSDPNHPWFNQQLSESDSSVHVPIIGATCAKWVQSFNHRQASYICAARDISRRAINGATGTFTCIAPR